VFTLVLVTLVLVTLVLVTLVLVMLVLVTLVLIQEHRHGKQLLVAWLSANIHTVLWSKASKVRQRTGPPEQGIAYGG
jgi:hypothetical protein